MWPSATWIKSTTFTVLFVMRTSCFLIFLLQHFDLVYRFVRIRVLAAVPAPTARVPLVPRIALPYEHRHFVKVINRKTWTVFPLIWWHYWDLPVFTKLNPYYPNVLFVCVCVGRCRTARFRLGCAWFADEIFNRSNPFLCAPRCMCVTDRVNRCAF
jgi:hypothetical protein